MPLLLGIKNIFTYLYILNSPTRQNSHYVVTYLFNAMQ